MALVSIMSAKGAPGTTTTSMLLANLWPAESILVDADPLGGDVALRLPGEHGPLDPNQGLMSLLPSARRGLEPQTVVAHAQTALGGQQVLAGLPGPEQAVAAAPLWPSLAQAFARIPGVDVFADIGQVSSRSTHLAMVESSAALLCVYRPRAWSAIHTRRRLESLEAQLRDRQTRVGIVCVAAPAESHDVTAAAGSITDGLPWVTDYGVVAHDDATVVIYEGGEVFRPERSLLARSGHTLARRLYADLAPVVAVPEGGAVADDVRARAPKRGRRRAS
jgi:MinD-like ATPase involved in chromosome partitioning or flagellar assembly